MIDIETLHRIAGARVRRSARRCAVAALLALGGCAGAGIAPAALPALHADASSSEAPAGTDAARSVQSAFPATLVVTRHVTNFTAAPGIKSLTCAVSVTSSDPLGPYMIVAYGRATQLGVGAFPIGVAPETSAVSLAIPDLGTAFEPLANAGFPGRSIWHGAVGETQTHCVDMQIAVPDWLPQGDYSANVHYALLMNVGHGLYVTRALQSAAVVATVGPSTPR